MQDLVRTCTTVEDMMGFELYQAFLVGFVVYVIDLRL